MAKTAAEVWAKLPAWKRSLLIILDQYVNLRTGGIAGETVSERLAKDRAQGGADGILGCAILDRIDPGHCDRALKGH